jgi:hypothetical protein
MQAYQIHQAITHAMQYHNYLVENILLMFIFLYNLMFLEYEQPTYLSAHWTKKRKKRRAHWPINSSRLITHTPRPHVTSLTTGQPHQ